MIIARYIRSSNSKCYDYSEVVSISFPHCSCKLEAMFEISAAVNASCGDTLTLPDGRIFPTPNSLESILFMEEDQFIGLAS